MPTKQPAPILFGRRMVRRRRAECVEHSRRWGAWVLTVQHYPAHAKRPFYAEVKHLGEILNWRWCASEAAAVKFIERDMRGELESLRYLVEGT
jgi:hypothetical protein